MEGTTLGGEADTLPKGGPRRPPVLITVQRAGAGGGCEGGPDTDGPMVGDPVSRRTGCWEALAAAGPLGSKVSRALHVRMSGALLNTCRNTFPAFHSIPVPSTPPDPTPPV